MGERMYENEDMVTTVITSIPNKIDRNIAFMEDAKDLFMNMNGNRNENDDKLSVYQQRKENKRKVQIRESKKKYQRKVKKMLKFVKEFNRNKKRKANAKRRKKKPKKEQKVNT